MNLIYCTDCILGNIIYDQTYLFIFYYYCLVYLCFYHECNLKGVKKKVMKEKYLINFAIAFDRLLSPVRRYHGVSIPIPGKNLNSRRRWWWRMSPHRCKSSCLICNHTNQIPYYIEHGYCSQWNISGLTHNITLYYYIINNPTSLSFFSQKFLACMCVYYSNEELHKNHLVHF